MDEFRNLIERTVDPIVNKFDPNFTEFQTYLDEHGWPLRIPLPDFEKGIMLMINEELPNDPAGELIDLVVGQTRKAKKLTKKQKGHLYEMLEIARAAKKEECDHTNLGIAPFVHGGGFTPIFVQAELICLDCGANVTLYPPKSVEMLNDELGLDVTRDGITSICEWAMGCLKNSSKEKRHMDFAEKITRDPIKAYNSAGYKWEKPIPFKITDKKAFESRSGK